MVLLGRAIGEYPEHQAAYERASGPYRGAMGGALYDARQADRDARNLVNLMSAVAARKARTDKLGRLAPRPVRATVAGGRTTAKPTGRT